MPKIIRCRLKPFLQEFERHLALRELESLAGALPLSSRESNDPNTFEVETARQLAPLRERLAYWETVGSQSDSFTAQVLRESTVNVVRNGIPLQDLSRILPFDQDVPLPNRRILRYATHGIHEYRGKFFPQLVTSLVNYAGLRRLDVVADPMCGSGTTVVESALHGLTVMGMDMNPLSTLITRTKCKLVGLKAEKLEAEYECLKRKLLKASPLSSAQTADFNRQFSEQDLSYLKSWFSPEVLSDLNVISYHIARVKDKTVREYFLVCLSNILRSVSYQKNDDLRVRKEIKNEDADAIREFLEGLGRSVRFVLAFLRQFPRLKLGKFTVDEGDARSLDVHWKSFLGRASAIVTSPPYATALPYLDTDRLSLIYLRLLSRDRHRAKDALMIGNREITDRARRDLLSEFGRNGHALPSKVCSLIRRIEKLNQAEGTGFRRKNMSALLSKYFFDMKKVLGASHKLLKKGGHAFFVVGNNHTVAGGEHVDIPTVDFLRSIGESVGFKTQELIPMDMLVSRDIFRKNAIGSESIICFRK